MPPKNLLSGRDGRTTPSPASPSRRDQIYSEDDIKVMFLTVKRGQQIQLEDTKGNQTGVSALFVAADEIFPKHNLSPDDPKMSSLLFKIGSKRGVSENLLEKFRSVLDSMGIEVTIDGELFTGVEDVAHLSSPVRVARSIVSVTTPSSVSTNIGRRAVLPIPTNFNGRRRRNSDTTATEALENVAPYTVPPRRRAASLLSSPTSTERPPLTALPPSLGQKELPILSKWLLEAGAQPGPVLHADGPNRPGNLGGSRLRRALSIGDSSLDADEVVPDLSGAEDGMDGNYEGYQASPNQLPLRPGSPVPPEDVSQEADVSRNGETAESGAFGADRGNPRGQLQPSPMSPSPPRSGGGVSRDGGSRHNPDLLGYLYRSHPEGQRQPPSYAAVSNAPQANMPKPSWLQPHFDRLTTQGAAVLPLSESRLEDLELKVRMVEGRQVQASLAEWRESYENLMASVHGMNTWAFTLERRFLLTRTFKLWRGHTWKAIAEGLEQRQRAADAAKEEAEAIRREAEIIRQNAETARQEAEAAIRKAESARREAENARLHERMMRRAARAADLSLLHKAFTHWRAAASHEAERTEIARRHLLRKKVFVAWSEKVSADRTKVKAFAATGLLGAWSNALEQHREVKRFSAQMYPADLAKRCFTKWRREYQSCAAELWYSVRLAEDCVHKWKHETSLCRGLHAAAEADAVHSLRASSIGAWRSMSAETKASTVEASDRLEKRQLSGLLSTWHTQAMLESRLRRALVSREERIKTESLHVWKLNLQAAGTQKQAAQRRSIQGFARHWVLELELKLFRENVDSLTLLSSTYQWVLESRSKLVRRFNRKSTQNSALLNLRAEYAKEKRRRKEHQALAKLCYKATIADAFIGAMSRQLGESQWMEEEARRADSAQVTAQAVQGWAAQTAEHEEMEDAAQRGAFYVGAINCLHAWPRLAKAARQERLRLTYLAFRRNMKIERRAGCLAVWREATYNSAVTAWEFERRRQEQLLDEMVDWLNDWIGETNRMIGMGQTAVEVGTEAAVGAWRGATSRLEATWSDAAAYEAEAVATARLEDWELRLVTIRGREHTASGLAEKNRKRLARQALGFWLGQLSQMRGGSGEQEAALSGGRTPLRSSLRRSQAATAPPAFASSPFFPPRREGGPRQTDEAPPPTVQPRDQRPPRPHSQPDLGYSSTAMSLDSQAHQRQASNNASLGGSYRQPKPPVRLGAGRFSQSTSGPYTPQPSHQQQQQQQQQQQHGYPYTTLAGARDSILAPISERSEGSSRAQASMRHSTTDSNMGPSADRLRSFREKLASASRFADSLAEFDDNGDDDDDNDGRAPSSNSRASRAAGKAPMTAATRPPPVVMDTPTRWTGMPTSLAPSRRGDPGPTTTPMAPLPSPVERQLRREYAPSATMPLPASSSARGGGIARPNKLGRSWAGRPPRVTFSGVDQDSDGESLDDGM
ncbi:hypothetical protein RB597_009674 [Gaeumannomyces tritici]